MGYHVKYNVAVPPLLATTAFAALLLVVSSITTVAGVHAGNGTPPASPGPRSLMTSVPCPVDVVATRVHFQLETSSLAGVPRHRTVKKAGEVRVLYRAFCSLQPQNPQDSGQCTSTKPLLIYSAQILRGSRTILLMDLSIGKCRTADARIGGDIAFYLLPRYVARLIARMVSVRM